MDERGLKEKINFDLKKDLLNNSINESKRKLAAVSLLPFLIKENILLQTQQVRVQPISAWESAIANGAFPAGVVWGGIMGSALDRDFDDAGDFLRRASFAAANGFSYFAIDGLRKVVNPDEFWFPFVQNGQQFIAGTLLSYAIANVALLMNNRRNRH